MFQYYHFYRFTGKHSRGYWGSTEEGLKWIKVILQSLDFRLQQLPRAFVLPPASLLEFRICNFPKGGRQLPSSHQSQIHLWYNFIDCNWNGLKVSKSGHISDGFYSTFVQTWRSKDESSSERWTFLVDSESKQVFTSDSSSQGIGFLFPRSSVDTSKA